MDDYKKLRNILFVFLGVYILNSIVPVTGSYSRMQRMWLLANIGVGSLSLIILIKRGLPNKNMIVTGLCLALAAGFIRPFTGVMTFLAFLASIQIFEQTESKAIVLKRPLFTTISLGLGVGIVLGIINLFFLASQPFDFTSPFVALLVSLNPGISEEIMFRLFIYAGSVYLLGGRIKGRKEKVWVYILMIIPHVLLHFPDPFFVDGALYIDVGALLISPLILSLLFGLPMALLLKKRDLTAAMITHTVVDFIRFLIFGLPF